MVSVTFENILEVVMNKVFKLIWNTSLGQWVVCSELGKKSKSSTKATILIGGILMSSAGFAAECNKLANGSVFINNNNNTGVNANCEVSSTSAVIGNTSTNDFGLFVYSQNENRSITLTKDVTDIVVKGVAGISLYGVAPTATSSLNAAGKTVNLTIENLDSNSQNLDGDAVAKVGLNVNSGGTSTIGTLKLTMENLPRGPRVREHYGVLTGSTASSLDGALTLNGTQSKAIFDNLNIRMSADNNATPGLEAFPLVVGIRAIQGAAAGGSGNGSAGYVQVNNTLNLNIENEKNDAIGIYVSGTEKKGVVPEVRISNSNISIASESNRANAIRLGKEASIGTGRGSFYSTGNMRIDTTQVLNDAAIDIISQGGLLDASAATANTTIKAGKEAITISGDIESGNNRTITSFNNLVINKTATDTANLIDVAGNQVDYVFTAKGDATSLIANTGNNANIINVQGAAAAPSKVTFNLANGDMQGLVNTTDASTLDVNLTDNATWQLAKNGNSNQAKFSTLNLTGSTLTGYDIGNGSAAGNQNRSDFTLKGDVIATNSQINMANGVAGDNLTIDGDYTTGGNTWSMDSYLTGLGQSTNLGVDGKSYTDTVRITGNVNGQTADLVQISNLNTANPTGKESILLYDIEGDSDGEFLLKSRVAKGGYEYLLNKVGGKDWYLQSSATGPVVVPPVVVPPVESIQPVIRPEVGSYLNNAHMANNLFTHRLEDRVGASEYTNMNQDNVGQLWLRATGGFNKFEDQSGQIETDGDYTMIHAGIGLASFGQNNEYNVGLMATYGNAETDSKSSLTSYESSSKVDGYGYGLYGTWFEKPNTKTGAYADAWVMWNEFDNEVSGQGFSTQKYDSSGITASIEAGSNYQFGESAAGSSYWIQPQAQFIYQDVQLDSFKESSTGTQVDEGKSNIQTRLGAKASMIVPTSISAASNYRPFAALNWIHNSNSEDKLVNLDNTYYGVAGSEDIGEIKLGLEGQTSQNSNAWINLAYQAGGDNYSDVIGNIGWKFSF